MNDACRLGAAGTPLAEPWPDGGEGRPRDRGGSSSGAALFLSGFGWGLLVAAVTDLYWHLRLEGHG